MKQEQKFLLAFDCTDTSISVAVATNAGSLLSRSKQELRFGHAAALMPLLKAALEEADIDFSQLSALVTTRGPGGFTGLRVGLATGKSLSLALNIPVIGYTSFEAVVSAISSDLSPHLNRLILLDSNRRDIYAQSFSSDQTPLNDPEIWSYEKTEELLRSQKFLLAGNGLSHLSGVNSAFVAQNHSSLARALISLYVQNCASNKAPSKRGTSPIYMRAPDVTLPGPSRA